nr:hypothetical protein HmN_000243400 [Hymenolepis microstoma]
MRLGKVMIACYLLDAGFRAISKAPTPGGGSALHSAVLKPATDTKWCGAFEHPFHPIEKENKKECFQSLGVVLRRLLLRQHPLTLLLISKHAHNHTQSAHDEHRDRRLSKPSSCSTSSSSTSSTSSLQPSTYRSTHSLSQQGWSGPRQWYYGVHRLAMSRSRAGSGAGEGGDGNGGVSGSVSGGGDDGNNGDNNSDVVEEAANQLFRSQLEQYDCKTFFTLTLLIKTSLGKDKMVGSGC